MMNEGDLKFKNYWEKIKLQGRIRYALINGAIFGFGVFIVLNLFYLKDKSIAEVYFQRDSLDQMVTMVLAGILGYGTIKWWLNERIYKKILKREEGENSGS